jgi:replicative DNA helicase
MNSSDLLPGESLKACVQSERQLLGCLLHRPDAIHSVSGIVSSTSFRDKSYAVLFETLLALVERGLQIDTYTIAVKVLGPNSDHEIESVLATVAELKHTVVNSANIVHYANQVAGWSASRTIRGIGLGLLADTNDCIEPPNAMELLAKSIKTIESANVVRQNDVYDAGELAGMALEDIDLARENKTSSGLDTGLTAIDTRWGGLHNGELVILAARPSIGKTALALSIACSMAEQGKSVFFASLEMTKQQVGLRLLSRMSGIPCDRLRMGFALNQQERNRLEEAKQNLKTWPIRVWCASGVLVSEIAAKARLQATKMGLDAIFIDYLGQGKIKPSKRHASANDSITEIVGDIANFTKQINKPIVCLCQLNRGAEGEEPGLQHLRDSGSLEQDADAVWFLHRKRGESETKLIVRKCRNGEIGETDIVFNSDRATFGDAGNTWDSNQIGGYFAGATK